MDLRSCLFTRQVFNTQGEAVGCIRVEFIPKVKRVPLRDTQTIRRTKSVRELECDEDLSSDTEIIGDSGSDEF